MEHLLPLALAWIAYFALHSLLASLGAKAWFSRHWPRITPHYRLWYNLFAALSLLLPLALLYHARGPMLWAFEGAWAWLANGLALLASAGFWHSLRWYDTRAFLGLAPPGADGFSLSPYHRFVRHPWYSFGLVILWTRDMDAAMLLSASLMNLYFVLGSRWEEQKLLVELGERYRRYREQVPGLLPNPWRYLSRSEADALAHPPESG